MAGRDPVPAVPAGSGLKTGRRTVLKLERELVKRLRSMRVRIDLANEDTAVFKDVPTNPASYSKSTTNLLIKRPRKGSGFLVCVDADLQYKGTDPTVGRCFAYGVAQAGWLPVYLGRPPLSDFGRTVHDALTLLGYDGAKPTAPPPAPYVPTEPGEGVLSMFGTNLTQPESADPHPVTVARPDEIRQITSGLLRWAQPQCMLIVGASGVGKTNLIWAAARELARRRPEKTVILVDLVGPLAAAMFETEREGLLCRLLHEAASRPDTILAVEHAELALSVPRGHLLLGQFLDGGGRIIATTLPRYENALHPEPLARRLHTISLHPLSVGQTAEALDALRPRLADHHGVSIDPSCLPVCLKAAEQLEGVLPHTAIAILDTAASWVALASGRDVTADDVYLAADRLSTP